MTEMVHHNTRCMANIILLHFRGVSEAKSVNEGGTATCLLSLIKIKPLKNRKDKNRKFAMERKKNMKSKSFAPSLLLCHLSVYKSASTEKPELYTRAKLSRASLLLQKAKTKNK